MSPIDPAKVACVNCKFGVLDEVGKTQIICRRYPPNTVLLSIPNPQAIHTPDAPPHAVVNQALPPMLALNWWCGEFARKPS